MLQQTVVEMFIPINSTHHFTRICYLYWAHVNGCFVFELQLMVQQSSQMPGKIRKRNLWVSVVGFLNLHSFIGVIRQISETSHRPKQTNIVWSINQSSDVLFRNLGFFSALPKTNSSHLKMDAWETTSHFHFEKAYFMASMLVSGYLHKFPKILKWATQIKNSHFPVYWLFNRDPYNGLWKTSPYNCAGTIPYMGVSENSGTPKSSILIGFSIINHPTMGVPLFLETPIYPEQPDFFFIAQMGPFLSSPWPTRSPGLKSLIGTPWAWWRWTSCGV